MKRFLRSKPVLSLMVVVLLAGAIVIPLSAHISRTHAANGNTGVSVLVPATAQWVNTGITLKIADQLNITATGSWSPSPSFGMWGPDGSPQLWPDNFLNLQDIGSCAFCASTPTPHFAALIGYIGDAPPAPGSYTSTSILTEAQKVFFVGSNFGVSIASAGMLWLNFNDDAYSNFTIDNAGQVTATVLVHPGTIPPPQRPPSYDPGNYAGKSGNVSIDTSGRYNELNDYQHRNFCGPAASQELISNWTSNVPDQETLATEENTNLNSGTLMKNMVGPINNAIGQSYYSIYHASSQADFSNMIGRDILDNQHPLITGIVTVYHNNQLNGWTVSANHIITIYGFDFSSPTVGYIYYYETSGTVGGTTATGPNRIDYNVFWALVQQLNIQLS